MHLRRLRWNMMEPQANPYRELVAAQVPAPPTSTMTRLPWLLEISTEWEIDLRKGFSVFGSLWFDLFVSFAAFWAQISSWIKMAYNTPHWKGRLVLSRDFSGLNPLTRWFALAGRSNLRYSTRASVTEVLPSSNHTEKCANMYCYMLPSFLQNSW